MLTEKQLNEIREHLEKAQNPIFFFDNDNDGLTSFLLLRRMIGRGKGVAVRSYPDLNKDYFRRVKELNSDYIFILDKPTVSNEFLDLAMLENIPVVWIDHHDVEAPKMDWIDYYNPFHLNGTNEPISYISYKISGKIEDLWIAVIGCVSDYYMPDFYDEFLEKYSELGKNNPSTPFDVLFNSEIGKIALMLDFSLKDSVTNVVSMLKFMIEVKSPYDLFEENKKTKQILRKYNEINERYEKLISEARKLSNKDIIYFTYGGQFSISANLANRIKFEFPDKLIVIGYRKDGFVNFSLRGKNARDITLKAIEGMSGATGGGHEGATGARISEDDLERFRGRVFSNSSQL